MKKLYHHAVRCAYPACDNPLYKVDAATGELVLNSHVCHINARRENGPRWSPLQSATENRSETNLVLMCLEHAAVIDAPQTLGAYPEELLREWKQGQIQEHAALRAGWMIDDTTAEAAAAASFNNVALAIVGSTISLGGQGGQAPGAGGGGGGAIGPRSKGGRGGEGGALTNHTPEHPVDPAFLMRLGEDTGGGDPVPGAGGGGSGATGPDAIGGDGGDGGELAFGVFDLRAPDLEGLHHMEIVVGEGGRPGWLPGQHPTRGGDTVVRFIDQDGRVLRTITAKGGGGATSAAFELPDDLVEVSAQDLELGFRVPFLMPVNSAEFHDGLLFVLGAAWSRFEPAALPCEAIWTVVCGAEWGQREGTLGRAMFLTLDAPDGREISRLPLYIAEKSLSEGTSARWIKAIGGLIDQVGRWTITLRTSSLVLNCTQVHVAIGDPD